MGHIKRIKQQIIYTCIKLILILCIYQLSSLLNRYKFAINIPAVVEKWSYVDNVLPHGLYCIYTLYLLAEI